MFTRDSRPPRIDTLIGRAAHVQGDVEFAGGLHLDGRIAGSVRAVRTAEAPDSTLSVSETGAIEGAVQAANVVLHGTVRGDIHARERLVLGATARVEGNVYYGVVEMTLGAQIMGKLVRLEPEARVRPRRLVRRGHFAGRDATTLTWPELASKLLSLWKA